MGMASQTTEREDNIIVEDLQGSSLFLLLSSPIAILFEASDELRSFVSSCVCRLHVWYIAVVTD